MYTDLIHYKLAPQISEKDFLKLTLQVRKEWLEHQPGFIEWTQHRNLKGGFTDIVTWASKADAKAAEKNMANNPHDKSWGACYTDVKSEHLESL